MASESIPRADKAATQPDVSIGEGEGDEEGAMKRSPLNPTSVRHGARDPRRETADEKAWERVEMSPT